MTDESNGAPDGSLGYDELPYPSAPYPYSHCDHLAMVARLFGIAAADARRCRVLEVGCADGANLIPMALVLPDSRFVGIDLSERQIGTGREVIARLGLPNVELHRRDLSDFGADETFDYIIAHGVFSWTTRDVQTRLLDLCRRRLAPQGVAFISYNVYPGWQRQKAIREWLLESTRGVDGAAAKLHASRRLMARLRGLLGERENEFSDVAALLERLEAWNDGYLRHDLLEDSNEPQYFTEFVERLAEHGLKFFAEADVASMAGADLPAGLADRAARLGASLVAREQLYDLLANRAFRQSLVCREECPTLERLDPAAIESAYVVSTLKRRPMRENDVAPSDICRFASRGTFAVDVDDPRVAAALDRLAQAWPGGAWFADLISGMDVEPNVLAPSRQTLARVLLAGFVERAVELHSIAPAAASRISPRPEASPLARLQAEAGPLVTNLRHDVVRLDDPARQMIAFVDGTNDRAALEQRKRQLSPADAMSMDTLLAYYLRAGLLWS
ncbi:MAG: hypothetical protein DCC68_06115 [Planctomycetota bacterium]|nr:MAG: hypothetical protein DCC68_06115 [Planctomycetota bacterium]